MMEVEYELTPEDLIAFQRYHRQHPSTSKSSRNTLVSFIVWIVVFAGVFALVSARDLFNDPIADYLCSQLPGAGVGAAVAFLGIILLAKLTKKNALQKALREGRNAEKMLGKRRVVLDGQGAYTATEYFTTTFFWKGIDKIATTNRHVFFYISTATAYIVPARAFPDRRAFAAFVEAARRFHGAADAGDAVWEMTNEGQWERRPSGIQASDPLSKFGTAEGIIPKQGGPHHT
jgi:YcxB-like protein